jgi:hypothetical protein
MSRSRNQVLVAAVAAALLVAACSGAPAAQPAGSASLGSAPGAAESAPRQGSGGAGGASLVEAAAAVTDACTLMPMDLAASIVPNAFAPQSQKFPPYMCTVSNGTSVVEITIAAYDAVDALIPNEKVPGLGTVAYLQEQQPDDAYVKVVLDPNGGAVYVEVAGHDGKDHGDDAIAVAKRVLEALQ